MAFPALGFLAAGLLGYRGFTDVQDRRANAKLLADQEEAFGNMLNLFIDDPNVDATGLQAALELTPQMGSALMELYRSDRDGAVDTFQQILEAQVDSYENALDREYDWAQLAETTAGRELDEQELELRRDEFDRKGDIDFQRELAMATDTGRDYRVDELTGAVYSTPKADTKEWAEGVDQSTAAQQLVDSYNDYALNVARWGIIRDPSHERWGEQQSLRAALTFGMKDATDAGALDRGLVEEMEKFTGSDVNAADFLLGDNDASAMFRLDATGRMMERMLVRATDRTRRFRGVPRELRKRWQLAGRNLNLVRDQVIPAAVERARAQGGQLSPTTSTAREGGNVMLNNLDVLGAAALGLGAGGTFVNNVIRLRGGRPTP